MTAMEFSGDTIPEELSNSVKNSVREIFSSILGVEPQFEPGESDKPIGDGVVGIISFVGDITWLLMLGLPKSSAKGVALKFAGFEVDYDSPDMGDVVGELNNVLAGDIIARLSAKGIKMAMSLPTVMRGTNVEPLLPTGTPSEKMRFSLPDGEIYLKIAASKPGKMIGRKPGA